MEDFRATLPLRRGPRRRPAVTALAVLLGVHGLVIAGIAAASSPAEPIPEEIIQPAAEPVPPRLLEYLHAGIDNGRLHAVAAGWIDRGQAQRVFLGKTADRRAPTGTDAFELGSTTRVFTGLLLAQALASGEVQRSQTLGGVFPQIAFADARLGRTTLEQLATQHSGLAALPPNLFPRNIDDPLADYDDAALESMLRHAGLVHDPAAHAYSDLGTAVLGAALARLLGGDYRQLVAERILSPLGMVGSGFGSVPGLLTGHYQQQPTLHWQHRAMAPAGGMRATLDDLLALAQHNLLADQSPERTALLLARQPLATAGGGLAALGWQVVAAPGDGDVDSWPVIWQAGISGGFASFIGFRTDRQRALILLGDARTDLSAAGLALLTDQELPAPPPRWHRDHHDGDGDSIVGLFALDNGVQLLLRRQDEGMDAQLSGGWPVPLHHEGSGRYRLGDGAMVVQVGAGLDADRLILMDQHFNLYGQRLSHGVPSLPRQPREMDADGLASYVGTYHVDDTWWLRVTQRGSDLFVQASGQAARRVGGYASDRFSDATGWMQLHFSRDEDGTVSGVQLRAGMLEASATRLY